MHRWFIPALGGQVDAVPGKTAETWFRADREGVYQGQSTFFSGSAYSVMRAWVRVVSPDAYRAVRRSRSGATSPRPRGTCSRRVTENAIPGLRSREPARPPSPRPAPRSSPRRSRAAGRAGSSERPAPTTSRSGSSTSAPRCASWPLAVVELVLMQGAADRPREHGDPPRDLRPGPVRVRGHRGDPVRDPAGPGADRLHRAASDRLARGRLPAPQPALVLALPGRGGDRLRQLPVPAVRGRPGGAAAALRADVFSNTARRRRLDRRRGARDPRLRLLRGQPRGHAAQHARARDGLAPRAPVLLGGRASAATCCW